MLHRVGDFEEWELADAARKYIKLYQKPGQSMCLIPYKDVPTDTIKHIKFEWLNEQWIYVDNDQEE